MSKDKAHPAQDSLCKGKKKVLPWLVCTLLGLLIGGLIFFTFIFPRMETTIVVPSVCFGYDLEDVPKQYKENGLILDYEILEESDTAKIRLTRSQQKYLVDELAKSSREVLEKIPYESAENSFLSIKANKDFTRFDVNMLDENYTTEDTAILSTLVYMQVLHSSFSGNGKTNLIIHFTSEETGEEFGVFDVSHIGTDQMSDFEEEFFSKFYGSSVSSNFEDVVQNQIDQSGMND